ncbi:MAG: hypothetical protein Kow0049_03660 [Stanieria sp.]
MSINHLELKNITDKIIECALKVSGVLGGGFVDKVYERALLYELEKKTISNRSSISNECLL